MSISDPTPSTRVLFVTWDGPQVSYLESLFVPIFAGLKPFDLHFDVLQFRWGDRASGERAREVCRAAGIGYRSAPIRRWGGGAGPFLSAAFGASHVRAAARDFKCDIIMPRSLMPALAVLTAGGCKLRPLLFDADGLPADERVDLAGLPATSLTYRILRDVEGQIIRHSKSVLTRSARSAEILYHRAGPPVEAASFHVVANGRDESVFHPGDAETRASVRSELGIEPSAPMIVYAGSLGPQYRVDAMTSFFREVLRLRPDTRFLLMTGNLERAGAALPALGAVIMRAAPNEVPRYLAAADVGLAYRATSFSMQGVAPIKLSEYLLCGLPVVGTSTIGDTGAAIGEGVFFADDAGSSSAAGWFVNEVLPQSDLYRSRARTVGLAHFSLRRSIEGYRRAIDHVRGRIIGHGPGGQLSHPPASAEAS